MPHPTSRTAWWPAAAAAVVAASLLSQASSQMEEAKGVPAPADDSDKKKKVLPMREVMFLIESRLRPFRTQRFLSPSPSSADEGMSSAPPATSSSSSKAYPKVAVLAKGKGADEPFTIEVPLPSRGGNEAKVLAACLQALQKSGHTLTFHTGLAAPEGTSLSFVLGDQSGSVLLTSASCAAQHPLAQGGAGGGGKSSLLLYKTDGFTEGDVGAVVDSYITAWSSSPDGQLPGHFMNTFADVLDALRIGGAGGGGGSIDLSPTSPSLGAPYHPQQPPSSSQQRPPLTRGGSVVERPGGGATGGGTTGGNDPVSRLRKLGAEVFEKSEEEQLDWTCLAGYDDIKAEVEDTVVMALQHAEAYEAIARQTRERYESNRPRAVLFEGPPGTGKTLTARIIASRTDVPLVFIPTERVLSKWYGDSEKNLAKIFEACQELGGAIIFIDEVDALATSRDSNMHEATRRLLSVILQSIEGFKGRNKNVLICATNRKQDLDAALLSRFDVAIRFERPNRPARQAIFGRYAKHLSAPELARLAEASEGFSCRDVKEVCENTERKWASKTIRGDAKGPTPTLKEYIGQLKSRGAAHQQQQHHSV